jgi:hypothetical protein
MLVHPARRTPITLPKKAHALGPSSARSPKHAGEALFVFGGVPILVDDAVGYVAAHRDAIIAALARDGADDLDVAIGIIDAAVAVSGAVEAAAFVDDFTAEEVSGDAAPALKDDVIAQVCDDATTPLSWIFREVGALKAKPGVIVEVGPGAGGLSSLLAGIAKKHLIVVDRSLRSVLLSRAKAKAAAIGNVRVVGVVGDACALPVADESADVVVAENVIDVVDDADAFVAGVFAALKPGGAFILTTPDPELDGKDVLERLNAAGYVVEDAVDGLRWPRVHSARHVELWMAVGIRARRPGPR